MTETTPPGGGPGGPGMPRERTPERRLRLPKTAPRDASRHWPRSERGVDTALPPPIDRRGERGARIRCRRAPHRARPAPEQSREPLAAPQRAAVGRALSRACRIAVHFVDGYLPLFEN